MNLTAWDRRGQGEECDCSGRYDGGECWKRQGLRAGGREDAVERTIGTELAVQKNEKLVPRALIQERVLVDTNYRSAVQERREESTSGLSWNVDHGPSKPGQEIVVMLREFEVLYRLGRNPWFIKKEEPVVDLVLRLSSEERLVLVRQS